MKTRKEVEDLKHNWRCDPCWDIRDTEGFEGYRDELSDFQSQWETRWEEEAHNRLTEFASKIGLPENLGLASYIMGLEFRLKKLE